MSLRSTAIVAYSVHMVVLSFSYCFVAKLSIIFSDLLHFSVACEQMMANKRLEESEVKRRSNDSLEYRILIINRVGC